MNNRIVSKKKLANAEARGESFEEPPTHHTITCQHCGQSKKTLIKYTRVCNTCRTNREYRRNNKTIEWTVWGEKIW